jgi:hypothetical protein
VCTYVRTCANEDILFIAKIKEEEKRYNKYNLTCIYDGDKTRLKGILYFVIKSIKLSTLRKGERIGFILVFILISYVLSLY